MVKNVRSIISAIEAAAARWNEAEFPPRNRALEAVSARTGYSESVVEHAFDRLFGALRGDAIEAVITDELGCLDVLDDFAERRGRPAARALPLGKVCVVSSRTTIGVAIVPAIFALCAKCEVLVKDREDHFIAAFFSTLADELPELRAVATAQSWTGEDDLDQLSRFDGVVVFGSDETLGRIAATLPAHVRFIGFGSRASAGYVTREALRDDASARALARDAARDAVLYEGEGCLSLHALFVEQGGRICPQRFAEMLADTIRATASEFPPSSAHAQAASRIAAARDLAVFRAGPNRVHSDSHAAYLAVLDPPFDQPPLFLPRTIGVHSVDSPLQAAHYLERHAIRLEALAIATRRSDLLELATRAGAARVAAFGTLQAPNLAGFHGGRPRIAEFVRWIADET
jgi:acyl-CoA reductase-like NAD-dependent aldehyde dehydrogenase